MNVTPNKNAMWLNPEIGDSPMTKVQLHGGLGTSAGSIRAPNSSIGGVLGLHPASQGPLEPKTNGPPSVPRRVPSSNLVV